MGDTEYKYSVGKLRNPRPEDHRFEVRQDALAKAFDCAKDDDVWAVWVGGEIAAVIYDGQMFT
jgi:hypothetical protein